jgi:hypothetical protein
MIQSANIETIQKRNKKSRDRRTTNRMSHMWITIKMSKKNRETAEKCEKQLQKDCEKRLKKLLGNV